jgi:hypothetical protein
MKEGGGNVPASVSAGAGLTRILDLVSTPQWSFRTH